MSVTSLLVFDDMQEPFSVFILHSSLYILFHIPSGGGHHFGTGLKLSTKTVYC